MALAVVPGRRSRNRTDPIGEIKFGKGRVEGRPFNNFPAIMAAFPEAISDIVRETTVELGTLSAASAPVQGHSRGRRWRRGDPEPGTLGRSMRIRFFKRRGTDITLTGRVDFKAKHPTRRDPTHGFSKAVEVGSTRRRRSGGHYRVPAEPFLVPIVVLLRPWFINRLKGLESRLPQ
jgi:hypothetical protein